MTITTEKRDLFTVPQGYYLAHCVSSDFELGAGIAKTFNSVYNMRYKLFRSYSEYEYIGGDALPVDNVFNLVTKERYWHKPTYETLRAALKSMKEWMEFMSITKVAMPRIGCGLDKLEWSVVYEIICEVFEDSDVEIVICEL